MKIGSSPHSRWPYDDLEEVGSCPYCSSRIRELAFRGVKDWTFGCAQGDWDYWRCGKCAALYLDPRPTSGSIGRAYKKYYTHDTGGRNYVKDRIRNLCYFAWFEIDLRPRIHLPKALFPLLGLLRSRVANPSFITVELNSRPRGHLLDVGCGKGEFLDAARQLGWETVGVEFDPEAAKIVAARGHKVIVGSYDDIRGMASEFDVVICSHVVEHVHDPRALVLTIRDVLKPDGVVLFSLPNANSEVLEVFGENWRGLEAPRHLSIPSCEGLIGFLANHGLAVSTIHPSGPQTVQESLNIVRRRGMAEADFMFARGQGSAVSTQSKTDFINLVAMKV